MFQTLAGLVLLLQLCLLLLAGVAAFAEVLREAEPEKIVRVVEVAVSVAASLIQLDEFVLAEFESVGLKPVLAVLHFVLGEACYFLILKKSILAIISS
jgi:hypothetical protein